MTFEEAVDRLRNHSPLPGSGSADESLSYTAWRYTRKEVAFELLRPLCVDVMSCFDVVNRALNSDKPSEKIGGKAEQIDRGLALYPQMISLALFEAANEATEPESKEFLALWSYRVGLAWSLVLHGDIDDIRGDVEMAVAGQFG